MLLRSGQAQDHIALGEEITAEAATQAARLGQHADRGQVLALVDTGHGEEGDPGHEVEEQAEGDTFDLAVVLWQVLAQEAAGKGADLEEAIVGESQHEARWVSLCESSTAS